MWLRLYIFPLLVARIRIINHLFIDNCFVIVFVLKSHVFILVVPIILGFCFYLLLRACIIASTIRKYLYLSFDPFYSSDLHREPNQSQVRLFVYTLSKRYLLYLLCFKDFWLYKVLQNRISIYSFKLLYKRDIVLSSSS